MEDYLRQFRLGPRTPDLAWLDCGSGADGLRREWDLGPDGAHGLSEQERDAVRFRVAQGIVGRPGDAPQGWQRWAEEAFHPPQPWRDLLGAAVRSAASAPGAGEDYTYGRPSRRSAGAARRRAAEPAAHAAAGRAWSSTPRGRSVTPNWAARCSRSPRSPGPWAAAATWSPCCRATRRPGSRTRCAVPRASRWSAAGVRICARVSPRRCASRPRPDVVVVLTDGQTPWPSTPAAVPDGGRPVPPGQRRSWDEDDPDYVPDAPPAWARVVPSARCAVRSSRRPVA